MSNGEASKKRPRRKNPAQVMKRGDEVFFAINSQIVEEPIFPCIKWGKPCEAKDEKISLKNICWFYSSKHGVKRLLRNSENKLRIPSDAELIKIYSNTTKKEGDKVTIKGASLDPFDPRWADLKGKVAPKKKPTKKKPAKKRPKVASGDDGDSQKIAELEKKLKALKKKK